MSEFVKQLMPYKPREGSDESYVIDLCNQVLGREASRQKTFDFLRGDSKDGKKGRLLPVDAYYEDLGLVVEYNEYQHSRAVPFFDKRETISGVSRGEQRRIYDERRRKVLPEHGIKLVTIDYTDFGHNKKISRNHPCDMEVVRKKLREFVEK